MTAAHGWRLSPKAAVALQRELASQVRLEAPGPVERVVGLDCCYDVAGRGAKPQRIFAAAVVWHVTEARVLELRGARLPVTFPYVPGLLSFREAPALLAVLARVRSPFDALMCDGQGVAHPRRFGLAAHLGVLVGRPALGVAKSRLCGGFDEPPMERGGRTPLSDRGERIGTVLRTRTGVRCVYVSPGHLMDWASAEELALATSRTRIPEPTRLADHWVARYRRGERIARVFPGA